MSEPIGLASGLVALSTFALNSSVTLLDVICSFRDHPKRVRDLVDEVDALTGVLHPLKERVESTSSAELITLNRPLLRCGKACEDFRQALESCASQSGDTQAIFRGWAKLKYMGDDVDGFRRLLAGYKSTISIALTDANLRVSSATAETLRSYVDLVESTNSDLRAHIDNVDEKMEALLQKAIPEVGPEAAELKTMQEERLSAQQCLSICDQLSRHINQIQRMGRCSGAQDGDPHLGSSPETLMSEGLQGCKETLDSTVAKLEDYEKSVFDRLVKKMRTSTAEDGDVLAIANLREEWENAHLNLSLCSKAKNRLEENISVIDNYATGDAVQFMVSTTGKTIRGRNRGLGWRSRQLGGHLSDEAVRQISRDMISHNIRGTGVRQAQPRDDVGARGDVGGESRPDFGNRYGPGFTLSPKSPDTPKSPGSDASRQAVR